MTMPSSNNDAKALLSSLDESALSNLLGADPELLKRAMRAINDVKKRELAAKNAPPASAAPGDAPAFNPKLNAKAIKLITGPHNPDNEKELEGLIATGLDVNAKDDKGASLLQISIDYLGTKQMVEFQWPHKLLLAGAKLTLPETRALIELYEQRDPGGQGVNFIIKGFRQNQPWAEIEKECAPALQTNYQKSLCEFYYAKAGRSGWGTGRWRALENLVRSGCAIPEPKTNSTNYSHTTDQIYWQKVCSLSLGVAQGLTPGTPKYEEQIKTVRDARIRCFEAFSEMGWLNQMGVVSATDNLDASAGGALSAGSRGYYGTPSRGFIATALIDASSVNILELFCEHESANGMAREYDEIGRSRLYFVNERARSTGAGAKDPAQARVFEAWVKQCIQLGDKPESVNAQNPIAKSCASLRELIRTQIERNALSQGLGEQSAAPRKRAANSL